MKHIKRFFVTVAGLAALFFIVVVLLVATRDWERGPVNDEIRSTTEESYIELSYGVTEYQIAGPDSARVVLFLCGASVPYYIWDGTFEHIAENGFRVIRFNYYGRGFSDRPEVVYDRELYERQILDLLDELDIEGPVDLVGLSMGGWVGSSFAASYPDRVRKIVFIDPAFQSFAPPSRPEWLARVLFVLGAQESTAEGQLTDFLHPDNFPDWVKRYKIQMRYDGFRYGRISTFYHFGSTDHLENFRQIGSSDTQTMLIWGKQDRTLPFSGSETLLKILDPEFLPVDSAGHLPHLEQTELVNPAIAAFLRGGDALSE